MSERTLKQLMEEIDTQFRIRRLCEGDTPLLRHQMMVRFMRRALSDHSEAEVRQYLRSVGLEPKKPTYREDGKYHGTRNRSKRDSERKYTSDGGYILRGVKFGGTNLEEE